MPDAVQRRNAGRLLSNCAGAVQKQTKCKVRECGPRCNSTFRAKALAGIKNKQREFLLPTVSALPQPLSVRPPKTSAKLNQPSLFLSHITANNRTATLECGDSSPLSSRTQSWPVKKSNSSAGKSHARLESGDESPHSKDASRRREALAPSRLRVQLSTDVAGLTFRRLREPRLRAPSAFDQRISRAGLRPASCRRRRRLGRLFFIFFIF